MTDPEFEKIMRRQINSVLRLACAYLKCYAEAEDIAQEVLLKLYRSEVSFESQREERAWLLKVTANLCKNRLRSPWYSKRADIDIPEEMAEYFPDEEKTALTEVMKLPEKYRTPIHLFYCEEYSVKEISEITGIKESTVRTRLQRGRELLRLTVSPIREE
ncbi:MAG: sigma-70 family RNA polymerase sigma factor [Oscillospiraceae bacterium]|nr:sigma-70 family RNA polymerase sigma factor [Oscillospiraceae bacterium]